MKNSLYNNDIISIKDLTLEQIQIILTTAVKLKKTADATVLQNKIIAHCFFEPSTRTRLSFEAAALRLGAQVIGFANEESSSIKKGESLHDTMRIIDAYADLIVIRHPQAGAARLAAEVANKPVINAGDGANQHPTQALIDLFTIQETQKKLDGLAIAVVGDLKYGRAVHSFIQICTLFDIRLYFVAPEFLALPDYLADWLKKYGVKFSFHQTLEEVIPKVDILYMTRVQYERFAKADFQGEMDSYILTAPLLKKAKKNLKVLHPLPRVREIEVAVDASDHAAYFAQAANGVCVRQALFTLLLNE
jgi:aspartate carbamoyltransferase catalytic subunit